MDQVITLLSDFGTRDGYVAAMKGVMLDLAPRATLVDAGHDVPPQDVAAGAWALAQYAFHYPRGTIHVAVVDPGVGSGRQGLVATGGGQVFIAPDNGLLHWVRRRCAGFEAHVIRPGVHRPEGCAPTFHGRDVFACVAGRLATGYERIADLADPAETVVEPAWGRVRAEPGALVGEVIHVDHYGNVVTSLHRDRLEEAGWPGLRVRAGGAVLPRLHRTYSEVAAGRPVALIGSHEHLEIGVYLGSAAETLGLARGDEVVVEPADEEETT